MTHSPDTDLNRLVAEAPNQWQTSGYMISRDGGTCTLWLSGQDAYQVCSIDPTMPNWLFDPGLNYHGMGVAFRVKIPRDYVKAESLEGITWSDWERQPYDCLTESELFGELTRHFYPDGVAE
jgi:hypothetical protein